MHGKSEPSPIEKQRSEQRARFTHEDLHNQVFPKSQSPSKRELPTPPSSGSPVSAPTHLPVLRRPRSGTLSTRPPLPTPPGEAPAALVTIPARPPPPVGRQLPPAPAEGSSLPQPRAYGLPASPSVRRASTFVRTNPTLPSVPEPNASLSPGVSSASPRHAMTTSPLPVSPESARPVRRFLTSYRGIVTMQL